MNQTIWKDICHVYFLFSVKARLNSLRKLELIVIIKHIIVPKRFFIGLHFFSSAQKA